MAKSSKFVFTIILFGEKYERFKEKKKKKKSLDLIKPWQTLWLSRVMIPFELQIYCRNIM